MKERQASSFSNWSQTRIIEVRAVEAIKRVEDGRNSIISIKTTCSGKIEFVKRIFARELILKSSRVMVKNACKAPIN